MICPFCHQHHTNEGDRYGCPWCHGYTHMRKDIRIAIRVTEAEAQIIKRLAAEQNRTVSNLLITLALEAAQK